MKLRCPVSKFIAHTISHVFFLALLAFATFGSGEELGDVLLSDDDHDNHEHNDEEGGLWSFLQSELFPPLQCHDVVHELEARFRHTKPAVNAFHNVILFWILGQLCLAKYSRRDNIADSAHLWADSL